MGGGLMQLVAYGAQDVYLTGNPQITFFKVVYRRHTNFSMECIRQTCSGSLTYGNTANCTISRNGDLVSGVYVSYKETETVNVVSNFGNALFKNVEVNIGGQLIDRQDGRFMQIYTDLCELNPSGNPCGQTKFQKLAGIGCNFNPNDSTNSTTVHKNKTYWVPLKFWFCRNPGLALPLIALQYHEVQLKIDLAEQVDLVVSSTNTSKLEMDLWVNYIYLDTDERRRFAQVSHEYLIEQVQIQRETFPQALLTGGPGNVDLHFNHPVKEIMWVYSKSKGVGNNEFPGLPVNTGKSLKNAHIHVGSEGDITGLQGANAANKGYNQAGGIHGNDIKYTISLNGQERFQERDSGHFNLTQIYKHHSGYGSSYPLGAIHVYSFALKPEEHQPSGTCNFSRIDSSRLQIEANTSTAFPSGSGLQPTDIYVYAVNYNVLRIMSGMGGLAYSN